MPTYNAVRTRKGDTLETNIGRLGGEISNPSGNPCIYTFQSKPYGERGISQRKEYERN
jgi:hypothetical protein